MSCFSSVFFFFFSYKVLSYFSVVSRIQKKFEKASVLKVISKIRLDLFIYANLRSNMQNLLRKSQRACWGCVKWVVSLLQGGFENYIFLENERSSPYLGYSCNLIIYSHEMLVSLPMQFQCSFLVGQVYIIWTISVAHLPTSSVDMVGHKSFNHFWVSNDIQLARITDGLVWKSYISYSYSN